MKDWILWGCFTLLLAALSPPEGAIAQQNSVQTFGIGHEVVRHSTYDLTATQSRAYREFRGKAGYFGAIAVHKAGSVFSWFQNMHSLSIAREAAIAGCEITASAGGDDPNLCVLYASMIPEGHDPYDHSASGVGEGALQALNGKYQDAQTPGRFGAFAISGMAAWGYSAGRISEVEAVDAAIAFCEAYAAQDAASYNNEARRRIAERRLSDCKVIHVTKP